MNSVSVNACFTYAFLLSSLLIFSVSSTLSSSLSIPSDAAEDDMDSASQSQLLCNLCEKYLAPSIVEQVQASEEHHDTAASMEALIERIIAETEGHVHRQYFHEYLNAMLWDIATMRKLSALQRVYHRYDSYRSLFEQLVDHVVCSCKVHEWEHSRAFVRYLEKHAAVHKREFDVHAERDGSGGQGEYIEPALPQVRSQEDAPKVKVTEENALGSMPAFAGRSTGREVQGEEL